MNHCAVALWSALLTLCFAIARGAVVSDADALSHTASSGTTKLVLNSDQGHDIQVGGTNVATVTSSGIAATGVLSATGGLSDAGKAYVYGSVVNELHVSTSFQPVVWSSAAGDVVTNGAMSWGNNKDIIPTNTGLYRVTAQITMYFEPSASGGERKAMFL